MLLLLAQSFDVWLGQSGVFAPKITIDVQDGVPLMDGFVEFERLVQKNASVADAVMQGFSDGALPISTALASEFAVFDRWFTAFPGPSWPNHMFSYSATANGNTNTGDGYLCEKDQPYPQRTIFDSLIDAGYEYMRIYKYVVPRSNFNFDVTPSPRRRRRKTASKRSIGAMSHVASTPSTHRRGAAPSTRIHVARPSQRLHNRHLHGGVWIEGNAPPDAHHGPLLRRRGAWHAAGAHLDRPAPGREHVARCVEINQRETRTTTPWSRRRVDGVEVDATILHRSLGNLGGPNSDHPSCCDVALGERLRKDIYEALRVPVHKSNSESGAVQQWRRRVATI